jgi:hypothetical protein
MPTFVKPPSPPPPSPVAFHCPRCDQRVSFTRAELAGTEGPGVMAWTKPCGCGASMRRVAVQTP